MRPLCLYLVDDEGSRFLYTLGWDAFAKVIAANTDHIHTNCRWAFAVDQKGWLCKFYEGIEGTTLSEYLLKGKDVQAFARQVNQLLGHTPADVRQIIQTTCQKLGIPTEYYLPG